MKRAFLGALLGLAACQQCPPPPSCGGDALLAAAPAKWEYTIDPHSDVDSLNALGREGWDCFFVVPLGYSSPDPQLRRYCRRPLKGGGK